MDVPGEHTTTEAYLVWETEFRAPRLAYHNRCVLCLYPSNGTQSTDPIFRVVRISTGLQVGVGVHEKLLAACRDPCPICLCQRRLREGYDR
jgi:hypothetical protein